MKPHTNAKRSLRLISALIFLIAMFVMPAHAAVPKQPQITSVTTTATTVKLTWSKVSGATGYRLYSYDIEGEPFVIATLNSSKKTYTVKKLSTGQTYTFFLVAYNGSGDGEASEEVEATPTVKGLEQIQNVVVTNGTNYVDLRYYRNTYASGYAIYRKNSSGKYKLIGTTKNVSYKVKGLKAGKTYYFKISTYKKIGGKTVYGVQSKEIVCKTIKKSALLTQVHDFYYKGVMRENYTTGGVTFKAGQTVTVTNKGSSIFTVSYKKKSYKIPKGKITLKQYITNYKAEYSKETAEAYVNLRGYSSSSKYLIWINTYTQHIYVFQGKQYDWTLIHSYICSTGMFGTDETGKQTATKMGKCYIYGKQYEFWFAGDQVAYYCSRINGGFIHSWLYKPDGSKYPNIGKLGVPASHGCVRAEISACKWIYKTVPVGTAVIVY